MKRRVAAAEATALARFPLADAYALRVQVDPESVVIGAGAGAANAIEEPNDAVVATATASIVNLRVNGLMRSDMIRG